MLCHAFLPNIPLSMSTRYACTGDVRTYVLLIWMQHSKAHCTSVWKKKALQVQYHTLVYQARPGLPGTCCPHVVQAPGRV